LLKDVLIFRQFQDRFASPHLSEKGFGIEPVIGELRHISLPYSDERVRIIAIPTSK
jgi:hypothetical protein